MSLFDLGVKIPNTPFRVEIREDKYAKGVGPHFNWYFVDKDGHYFAKSAKSIKGFRNAVKEVNRVFCKMRLDYHVLVDSDYAGV